MGARKRRTSDRAGVQGGARGSGAAGEAAQAGFDLGRARTHFDRALALYRHAREATRSQVWLLAVMVGFTTLALWLLSEANG